MSGGKFQVKAFSLAGTTSSLSSTNRRLQQQKAEKARAEEESKAAAAAYEEFVAAFENDKSKPKAFVKAGVVAPGSVGEREVAKQLYKPPRLEELEAKSKKEPPPTASSTSTPEAPKPAKPGRKKDEPKKKSNLELFKEELKIIQEEREERHRLKGIIKGQLPVDEPKESHRSSRSSGSSLLSLENVHHSSSSGSSGLSMVDAPPSRKGPSHDSDDPGTTNLYMSSLEPTLTEKDLCDIFGIFGPLASVKIMWPRSDEDRKKNRNYGFVAFMSRKDGERALANMQGKMVRGLEMRMSWSKAVTIPPVPYYIPPVMAHLTIPPRPSGLPFNCQPPPDKAIPAEEAQCLADGSTELQDLIVSSTIRVVAPSDRQLLSIIHRMVEFVVREGPLFEAAIMSKEFHNPIFRFLYDFQCPAHLYYRWRLFSILQGDHPTKYRLKKFRMFEGGSWWKPPVQNPWTRGMAEHLFKKMEAERRKDAKSEGDPATGKLTTRQRAKIEQMVRILTPEKKRIGETMLYCIEHAFAGEEIVDLVMDSLELSETPLYKKIARLYLVSDLLYNSTVRMSNASFFRPAFEPLVPRIIKALNSAYESIEDKEAAEQFKQRVLTVLKAWQEWSLYSNEFLLKMQNTFMGFDKKPLVDVPDDDQDTSSEKDEKETNEEEMEKKEVKTEPPKAETPQAKIGLAGLVGYGSEDDDSDQEPSSLAPKEPPQVQIPPAKSKFIASKWETVDPKVVEEQAVTTSKWDMFEDRDNNERDLHKAPRKVGLIVQDPDEDSDSSQASQGTTDPDDAERRGKLREIECEVLKLQDELEKKRRFTRSEIQDQCREFREKLVRRLDDEDNRKRDNKDRPKIVKENNSKESTRDRDKEKNSKRALDSDEDSRDSSRKRDRKSDKRRKSPSPTLSSRKRTPSPRRRSPSPYRESNTGRKRSKY